MASVRILRFCTWARVAAAVLVAAVIVTGVGFAADLHTAPLLLLHTNDIHDILKAPQGGKALGGMAYISGYVHQVRAQRSDVLVLDAGDLLQKGDAFAVVSKGEASYRALHAVGYDAIVPGNHDFAYGMAQLHANVRTAGVPMLCAGMEYEDKHECVFPERLEKKIGDVRVGIIGATAPMGNPTDKGRKIAKFAQPELGKRIGQLAHEMRPRVDLIVVLLHNGTHAALTLAKAAPDVHVFVCGHTNELLEKPLRADSGALVVEVGRAGQQIGALDMTVDLDTKKIAKYEYRLVPMDHKTIKPDADLAKQLEAWEQEFRPPPGEPATPPKAKRRPKQKAA